MPGGLRDPNSPTTDRTPGRWQWKRGIPTVKGNTDQNRPTWPGKIVATCMSYLTTGGPGNKQNWQAITNRKNLGKVKRREEMPVHMSYQPPRILLTGIHLGWAMRSPPRRTLSLNDWLETTRKVAHSHKTWDCEPHGRAVLLGSLTLLLSTQAPLPHEVSCFVSTCVSSDNSFPSIGQEPTLGPWQGSPFLQHNHWTVREFPVLKF